MGMYNAGIEHNH